MAKACRGALRGLEVRHHLELDLHHRDHDQLRDAIARVHGEGLRAAIPAGHHQLPLVVGVNEAHEIAEDDAVFVAESGAGQDDRGEPRIFEMYGDAGWQEFGLPGGEQQRHIEAGAQIEARGARGRIGRQRELASHTLIEDAHLQRAVRAAFERRRAHASAVPRLRTPPRAASSCAISAMSPRASVSLPARASSWRAARLSTMSWLSSQSKALSWPTSLAAIMSRFFLRSLVRAFCSTDSVSAAKPTTNGRSLRAATVASTSAVRSIASSSVSLVFLIFCSAARAGR